MAHHEVIDWLIGAAIVFAVAIFVAMVPPWRARSASTAGSLRSVRRVFVAAGLLLSGGTAVVLANTPVEVRPPRRSAADSLHYLSRLVDTAGAPWHLQALGAIAWRHGDTATSHWAIRRLMRLDCSSVGELRHDRRYHDELARDSAARALVQRSCP
jgi:hypothetical protein